MSRRRLGQHIIIALTFFSFFAVFSIVAAQPNTNIGCSNSRQEYAARGTALLINRFIEAILQQQNKATTENRLVLHRVSRSVNTCQVKYRSERCVLRPTQQHSQYLKTIDLIADSLVQQGVIEKADASSARILLSCAFLRESSNTV